MNLHSIETISEPAIDINTGQQAKSTMDELPSFPEGWYFVTTREAILQEKLIEKTWLGEEIVAWCDEAGRVCVADAVCPHLRLALGAGGRRSGMQRSPRLSVSRV